ncbi:hypothetical protein AB0L64_10550 [Kribbella sp. NPDC051936]|uniref:hypothetical protein n=1 Tax=Kribbella sp. NPDC051936 TaxID=3154946 RepID=UPI003441DEAB
MSLLFDTDEVSNFRDKLPPADFTEVAGLIKDGANLAGRMEESQTVQRIHLALLHELESFGTDVPLGIEALRQFADHVIGTYTGVDGDNAARERAVNETFRHVESYLAQDVSPLFPKLPDPAPK